MGDYGFKVVKQGRNVFTARSWELSYSSAFNTLKVFKKGPGTATVTFGTPTTVTVDHQLGYRPAFLVFSEIGS